MNRLLLLFTFVALTFVAACQPAAPGEGPIAEKGYSMGRTIVAALDKYKEDNGKYPQHLDELVPKYLSGNPQHDTQSEIGYLYQPEDNGNSYGLRFGYSGFFWTDECAYDPAKKTWICGGAS